MPTLRALLEVGAHIGHKKEHSHPAARRFTYTVKDGLLVINVEKTIEYLTASIQYLKGILKHGGKILFVGTKPQAKESVKRVAVALGQPYVVSRWLGGTLTNFETVKKSLFQLEELERKTNDPSFEQLAKRERLHLKERQGKLTAVFEGILGLTKMPDILFVVDAAHEDIAIAEANRLGIPVVAIMDTNANPDLVQFVIPVNDESKRAIELIMGVVEDELSGIKVKEGEGEREKEPTTTGTKADRKTTKSATKVRRTTKVTKNRPAAKKKTTSKKKSK